MNTVAFVSRNLKPYKVLRTTECCFQIIAPIHYRTFHAFRAFHKSSRDFHNSTTPGLPKPNQNAENPSVPSLNLWSTIREARPAVRYTVYAGLGLMATVESTFWFKVLKAKFFPSVSQEEQEQADQFLETIRGAVKGYRKVWLRNYNRYYGAHLWGLGYGGLDGLDPQ